MKQVGFWALLFLTTGNTLAQGNLETSALTHAEKMATHYNAKEFERYVDFLLPTTYGGDPAKKEGFVERWKQITRNDTSKMSILEVSKSSVVDGQYQALLKSFRIGDGFILGVSDDNGANWFFTTPFSKEIQFHQIIENIPTIDPAFAEIVDPGYEERINYEMGKTVAPFDYVDIYGKKLSSNSLLGKVIVLNFWYPACAPCLIEIPELNAIVERMKGEDVVFIAPAIYTSKEELIDSFLPKHPFNYQMVIIDNKDYSVTSFPTHVLIDQNFRVVEKITGYSAETSQQLENEIKELLRND